MDTSMILKAIGDLADVLARESNSANELRRENARILERVVRLEEENASLKAELEKERRINAELVRKIGQGKGRENYGKQ